MMTNRPVYKLRETIPNPAGGEWPAKSDRRDDAAIELANNALATTIKNAVLPRLLELHQGDTKSVASCLALMFGEEMRKYFSENRAEDQERTVMVYDEIIACFVAMAEQMKAVALLHALGVDTKALLEKGVNIHTINL